MGEELVTVEETARMLRVRRETIRRYIKSGHLKAVTLPGGDYRIAKSELDKILKPVAKDANNGS